MTAPVPPASDGITSTPLSPAERATLQTICETFFPTLVPDAGDDPDFFAVGAAMLELPGAMEQAIDVLESGQRRQFRLLLRALDHPAGLRLLAGQAGHFSRLNQEQRERIMSGFATSRWPVLRTSFQGLKRLACFLAFAVSDTNGLNPLWAGIGYCPSLNLPASQPLLRLTTIRAPTSLDCDVCVIGSGAGGSVVAAELAAAGKSVIVLEAGSGRQGPDFDQRELVGMERLYLDRGMSASRDLGVAILAGATLGGGTTVNWQTSMPLPLAIRDEWAERSGIRHFAEDGFSRSLRSVMERLNVGEQESWVNPNNAVLRDGSQALGYRWQTIPRNARGCDPAQCGACQFGCRIGGKQSTAVTYLHDAQQLGQAQIIANCYAERVTIARGRTTGVEGFATDPATGKRYPVRVRAPTVVVAAGGLHSPALLLRSGLDLPQLGRNLFLHPTSAVAGIYNQPIKPWHGAPQTIVSDEFANLQGTYGFRLEAVPAHPGLMALAMPWLGARDHRRRMGQMAYTAAMIVLTRDLTGGRVRLGHGGRPAISYRPGSQELAHLRQGIVAAARVHFAAGAEQVQTLHASGPALCRTGAFSERQIDAFCEELGRLALGRNWSTLFSAHQMGTCRMGSDPRTAVCDERGAVFGVRGLYVADASAFPASSGVNPMITIMALAHSVAQRID